MSKLNINKNEWLELVFEGKNKEYGAYQMRRDDGKTTIKAFFSALVLLAGIATLAIILSSFNKPVKIETEVICTLPITPVNLQPKTEQPKEQKTTPKSTNSKTPKFATPVVVKQQDAPIVEVPRNEDLPNTPSTNPNATGTGSGPAIEGNPEGPINPEPVEEPTNGIKTTLEVEKSPSFPGGINEFLRLVGNRFVTPEIEEEKIIKVLVYFVVEKDGSLSNITVPRSPGYGLDKEAMRVLKSIKTKWEPGIYKGKPVRTSYSLPIVIKMQ